MERKPSSSAIPPSSPGEVYVGRVCLICFSDCSDYNLFVLDFDGSAADPVTIKKSLTLRISDVGQMAFCASDPYLYVIFSQTAEFFSKPTKLSMAKVPLRGLIPSMSSLSQGNKSYLENHLVRAMNGWKRDPGVAPSPNGRKILVFSQIIEFLISKLLDFEGNDTDFEVFDTETGEWSKLPQLNLCIPHGIDPLLFYQLDINNKSSDGWILREGGRSFNKSGLGRSWYFRVSAGRFINGNTFLVTLEVGLMFTLNLDSPEEGWKPYGGLDIEPDCTEFLVFESLVLTPWLLKVMKDDKVVKQFDLPSEYPTTGPCLFTRLSLLRYVEDLECFTSITRGGVNEDTGVPFLTCDIVKLDLEHDSEPTHLGSYKYDIEDMACEFFYVEDVFHTVVELLDEKKSDMSGSPNPWLFDDEIYNEKC